MTISTGTNHFFSVATANTYYKSLGYSPKDVQGKIERKEIEIGKPSFKNNERLIVKEGRYFIESE